jgi:hypothetical protein
MTMNKSGTAVRLTGLGVLAGACILTIHSFSTQAIDDEVQVGASPMTGATVSAMHAAIPDRRGDSDSYPSI